jgi:hypothetical protein
MKRLPLLLVLLLSAPSLSPGAVEVVRDRLSLDFLVSASFAWTRYQIAGIGETHSDFCRPAAFVGLQANVGPEVSIRVYTDVAALAQQMTQEFYLESKWQNGFVLRAGQLAVPLGREALTPQRDLKFATYSFVSRWWKPGDPSDVGIMTAYSTPRFDFAAAIVNGNDGRTYADDNKWKDVCARIAVNHLGRCGPGAAVRAYSGKTDVGTSFLSLAGEVWLDREDLQVLVQVQHAVKGIYERDCFVAQAVYRPARILEPVLRLQVEFQKDDRYDYSAVGGLNIHLRDDALLLKVEFEQWHKESNTPAAVFTQQKVLLKLQAAL